MMSGEKKEANSIGALTPVQYQCLPPMTCISIVLLDITLCIGDEDDRQRWRSTILASSSNGAFFFDDNRLSRVLDKLAEVRDATFPGEVKVSGRVKATSAAPMCMCGEKVAIIPCSVCNKLVYCSPDHLVLYYGDHASICDP